MIRSRFQAGEKNRRGTRSQVQQKSFGDGCDAILSIVTKTSSRKRAAWGGGVDKRSEREPLNQEVHNAFLRGGQPWKVDFESRSGLKGSQLYRGREEPLNQRM